MNVSRLLLCLNLLVAGPALSQGFAGLGTAAEGFAIPHPDHRLEFPMDHGAHPDFRIEWWYLTANLKDETGQSYGIQWTLFRSALAPGEAEGWQSPQIWMGHAGLTSATAHFSAERLARGGIGQAGVTTAPFQAWIDDWQMAGANDLSQLDLSAAGDSFSYELSAKTTAPLVLQGEQGYSVKSPEGQASYYYSQPNYQINGSLTLPSGPVAVTGDGWLDREWSSQPLSENQKGWDWFSLRFDSGDKLMGFVLRGANGAEDFRSGTWISATGEVTPLAPGVFQAEPLAQVEVKGRSIPTRWKVDLPERNVSLIVEALNPQSWMDVAFAYWEGPVTVSGSHSSTGYLEMTGYE
ncbi:lipocalin-like domain-containing protein [uncultured Pseudophaeobacter sp.]|uniref:lipocalin-like domain-containing protein n=1 Tax=uncultured Pseudophaeobacter sp. TaxID=1759421 RepID=UPI0025DC5D7F|nr:lipocalin-like domain-containing protein [uncultured Pseudophaeobacter sp.]